MPGPDYALLPVLHDGILITAPHAPGHIDGTTLEVATSDGAPLPLVAVGRTGQMMLEQRPQTDLTVRLTAGDRDLAGSPLHVQVGGWAGRVDWQQGALVSGWARNLRHPGRDVLVVAMAGRRVVACASARAAEAGQFMLLLPIDIVGARGHRPVTLGIAGSDFLLDEGQLHFGGHAASPSPDVVVRPIQDMAIRIKISTPNLKEAPMWGDYHFANSLAAAFERIGHHAGVDTADAWYAQSGQEDVVLTIRGRHRVRIDRSKINIMWIISHPDRIPEAEFADYDHVAVASDVYAAELRARGLPSVSVLHQATDATLFRHDPGLARLPACLFVGSSRKEYRTMVKWCVQRDIPLELYGGGWEGVLPDGAVRGTSVANADLASFYGSHLMLLNDHWDSMRENGFLSNRLFDGSAVATPILTDPVAGLADVFGDTINEAGDIDRFAAIVDDCLKDPAPYLERAERARDIVLGAHTFDHRARELTVMIDRIAGRKRVHGP